MKGLFVRWVVSAIALYITAVLAQWMHVGIELTGAVPALMVVVVLAIVNALIRPLLLIITLPLNCLTLGLLTWVINALMFWLVGAIGIHGFKVDGFLAAVIGSVLMGIVAGLMNSILTLKESV
jgi:putative membrane protein